MSDLKFVLANETTIHYKEEGLSSGIPLVFINSLGTDLRIWNGVTAHLDSEYRIIRYDKRGHGLSDCPPAPYTMRDLSDDLLGLLDHLGIKEAVFVGISVGGMIALGFALMNPGRVRALVLCDTGAKIGTESMWNERIAAIRQHGMEHIGETILARWFAPAFIEKYPDVCRGYYNMLTRIPASGYTGTCAALGDADLRDAVGKITAKTLVVCGAEDMATPPQLGRELAQSMAEARFVEIANAAHLPCIEQPQVMATIIQEFLQEVDTSDV